MRAVIDREGIDEMSREGGLAKHMFGIGKRVQLRAKATGPKRTWPPKGPKYAGPYYTAKIKVYLQRRPTPAVFVLATDFKSHWIEWGAAGSPYRGGRPYPAHHTLQNALRGSGVRRVIVMRKGES